MDIEDLFPATNAAYKAFKAKEAKKDEAMAYAAEAKQKAQAVYQAAVDAADADVAEAKAEYDDALGKLNTYRAQLNDILGNAASDPRFRLSA